jgi:trimethylamine--corrinoid protein Co-methyltransferase
LRFLGDEERATLREQTLTVLEEVGVNYNTPAALDLLSSAGVPVDRERLAARLPRDVVERCLELVPRQVLLAARDPAHDVLVGGGAPVSFTSDGASTYVYDDETRERREGTAADLSRVMRLFDALPELDYVWPTVSARDLESVTARLEVQAISLRSCAKHVQDEVRTPEFVAPLLEILGAVAGATVRERPILSVVNCTIAPLQHDGQMTEASIALARAGVPIVVIPMPVLGQTGPMSPAGSAVVTLAEALSAVVLFQLAAPGCPLIVCPAPQFADPRSGVLVMGAPQGTLTMLACVDVLQSWSLPVLGWGLVSSAKAPDFQLGLESGATCVLGALSGADTLLGTGTMDSTQATSLATIVLHADGISMVKRLLAETTFGKADVLLDDIRAVGSGGHFLGRRSTRERAHAVWQSAVLRHGMSQSDPGRTLVQDALERARHLLATHEVSPLPDDVERHIDDVIATHRRLAV